MARIGNVPEINEVKSKLQHLKDNEIIEDWELPYENLLTRLTAAIFFLTPSDESNLDKIWGELKAFPRFTYRENEEKSLSLLEWRVEFNEGFEL